MGSASVCIASVHIVVHYKIHIKLILLSKRSATLITVKSGGPKYRKEATSLSTVHLPRIHLKWTNTWERVTPSLDHRYENGVPNLPGFVSDGSEMGNTGKG